MDIDLIYIELAGRRMGRSSEQPEELFVSLGNPSARAVRSNAAEVMSETDTWREVMQPELL